ncbi:SGNH hydrolase [Rickenella mellea]|uniref:SGNH hydrolase n=1 Tax=Rickenella mellea TaxID=50990 RepID=A0A4Y7QHS9_9AGAM|nr:SGNH hydrolase [Rickenella mellea]
MFASLVSLAVAALPLVSAAAAPKPGIILIGDSTVEQNAGWGPGFCNDTVGLATCTDLAVSGTTVISWQHQPTQYNAALKACTVPNTFATIQFGHNDQKIYNTSVYGADLTAFAKLIKTKGCTPIIITSLARRNFVSAHVPDDILEPYALEAISVAESLGLTYLDLHQASLTYITKLGSTLSYEFNYQGTDHTHLDTMGQVYFGRMVADLLIAKLPMFKSFIVPNATMTKAEANGTL